MENETYQYWLDLKEKRQKEQQEKDREVFVFNNCLDKCVRFIHKCKGGKDRCWKRQHFSDY
jgi:hypothetical protein